MSGTVEKISRGIGDDDWLYCLCGNDPSGGGFYPCLPDGTEVEPDHSWDGIHYFCAQCGRIVDQDTLEVTGRRVANGSEEETRQCRQCGGDLSDVEWFFDPCPEDEDGEHRQ